MTWFLLRTKRIRKITMAVRLKIIAVTNDSISLYVLRSFSFDKMTKINTENVVKFSSGSFCFVFFLDFFEFSSNVPRTIYYSLLMLSWSAIEFYENF